MLEKYLQTQKDNLNLMQQRQMQLKNQVEMEQYRLIKLSEHIAALEKPEQMACSLSLKNLAGLKNIMQDLQQEQQVRSEQAEQEMLQQQQACRKQAAYNQGITELLNTRSQKEALKQQRQEQKVQDELSMQMFFRQQAKSF
ncbi:hypothetical protein QE250_13290 [Chromatiaceae bacterium AAb-1]|nr:hypothetical protein [Chromatiaceae bacterium AAb-1]